MFRALRTVNRFAAVALVAAALSGCVSTSSLDRLSTASPTGSPFTAQLFRNYSFLAHSFGDVSNAESFDTEGVASIFDSSADGGSLAEAFATKAMIAAQGTRPEPEPAIDSDTSGARDRLLRALSAGSDAFPVDAARAQTDFDCWMLNSSVATQRAAADQCHASFGRSIARLENDQRRPIAAPPPAASAAPVADYTVHFAFNSWSLSGTQLVVLENAIATARAGGQSRITVVGHTDTSGSAAYNQALSVRRANVVTETLVDMGARREAIQISGVGENDLAVPTGDNVREAKNRRTVVTLLP